MANFWLCTVFEGLAVSSSDGYTMETDKYEKKAKKYSYRQPRYHNNTALQFIIIFSIILKYEREDCKRPKSFFLQ